MRSLARLALSLTIITGGAGLTSTAAQAQSFPSRPITIIVPFTAGGLADQLGRMLADALKEDLGVSAVVENKTGAGGVLGARAAASAAADGHTLVIGTTGTHALNSLLYKNLSYDPVRDFTPVAAVAAAPLVLVVSTSQPFNSVQELVAYAKANPGKLSFGSGGTGTTSHLSVALLTSQANVEIKHIPYKGMPPVMADVMGGHVTMVFDNIGSVLPLVDAGKVRALAVTSAQRSPLRPELPTIREAGYKDYEVIGYYGLFAPAGTPAPIVERLNKAVNNFLLKADTKERFTKLGITPIAETPAYLGNFMKHEKTRWEVIIREAKISAD